MHRCFLLLALVLIASPADAEVFVWIDDEGVTHITDDATAVPDDVRGRLADGRLAGLWREGPVGDPAAARPGGSSRDEDRVFRLLRDAVVDLERGETARATAALRSVLRLEPGRAEAHWYLAPLERERGHFDASESHLRSFLAGAGEDLAPWRAAAEERLRQLLDERRLSQMGGGSAPLRLIGVESPHFRIHYDAALGRSVPDYAGTVLRFLLEARTELGARLGVVPAEPLGVVFYGKAAYMSAHRHRFSFQTVGFFDGRIHVASHAHPAGELRALLFHEYAHALFHEYTGGDRPLWFNEGLAVLLERASQGLGGLTRSERVSLRARDHEGRWIPLRRLAQSFSGLSDQDARASYLESAAAVAWIEARTSRSQRRHLLERLRAGVADDDVLRELFQLDTAGLERAVREDIRSEFPPASW